MARIVGGCLCGAVRYEADEAPIETGYCHCRMCQRQSGAPALSFATFRIEGFRYTAGDPQTYVSSAIGERRFCGRCGSSLEFRERNDPRIVAVNSGTLDDPSVAPPSKHIWTMTQISWFVTADNLPDHAENG
jgi:hypothetical protein